MTRGTLRIYLGAAPGVGKTFAMLNEGKRRHVRGTDVVIGFVETHGRPETARQIGDLEVIPRRTMTYRDATFEELDLDAILDRRPAIALIDELAHTNVPGARNAKRHQDVEELLAAGITVISTVNIQHLESLNDVVEAITGITQRETIPDEIVRAADQVELVDMTPEALRRRMAHGNVYASEKIDAALTNYFREGNLTALRELALLWIAGRVDDELEDYRARHGITENWETRERIVVALSSAPATADLIRRAARIAQRTRGDLIGLHVRDVQGLRSDAAGTLGAHRELLDELGGEYREIAGSDVALAIIDFASAENASQIVLGVSRQSRWHEIIRGSIVGRIVRARGPIDVHVIASEADDSSAPLPRAPKRRSALIGTRQRLLAWLFVVIGLPAMTVALTNLRDDVGLPTVIVLYLLFIVVTSALGGILPALVAAVIGYLAVNWYFTPPIHSFTIAEGDNVFALVAALIAATIVSELVARSNRRAVEATRANAEARTLSLLASAVVETDPLPTLITHLRRTFSLTGVTLLRRSVVGWNVVAADGVTVDTPEDADDVHTVGEDHVLALEGGDLAPEDHRLLNAFAAHLSTALERRQLQAAAAEASALVDSNNLRNALLQAVSHDLRTPLAGIKASANTLRQSDIAWSEVETAEFLEIIEDETDRMTDLVENLLDMSRINAGEVTPTPRPTGLDEVIPAAVASLGSRAQEVRINIDEHVPTLQVDPGILERIVANLVDNALTHGTSDRPVRVEAGCVADRVLIRVIDHGSGIPVQARQTIFDPFQRLDDSRPRRGAGVGLGLAVASGFAAAIGADLSIEDTPGGGTTMVVELEVRP